MITDDQLRAAHEQVTRADEAAKAARETRDALVRQARSQGVTIYHLSKTLGVSQNAVRYMLGL